MKLLLGRWLGKKLLKLAEAIVIHQLAALLIGWLVRWLKTFAEPQKKTP